MGIAGIAQSKILPVKFFKKTGPNPEEVDGSVADAARALMYSLVMGASVINASWTTLLDPSQVPDDQAQALKDAVTATSDAGVLLVCIPGNQGYNTDFSNVYPGSYQLPNQIVVAASDYNDQIWRDPFTTSTILTGFGPHTVHLTAPGVSIITTQSPGTCVECSQSNNPDDWYAHVDGTSASAAYVSGVAALVKSIHPSDTGNVVRQRIMKGVDVRANLQQYVITSG